MNNALQVKESADKSSKEAYDLYNEKEANIKKAIEDTKIVKEITKMVNAIKDIAEQTNLLSLMHPLKPPELVKQVEVLQ